jgi:eukaryotic-like serine/threonine-protein kinase
MGRKEESQALWRLLAEAKAQLLGESDPDTLLMRAKRAEVLKELGRREGAAAEYGTVAELRAATLGADHPDARRARDRNARILRDST